jgi:hypothetical protein
MLKMIWMTSRKTVLGSRPGSVMSVLEADSRGGFAERTVMPKWGDPFEAEWRACHHCVTTREQPRASAADFRQDLDLFVQMVRSM